MATTCLGCNTPPSLPPRRHARLVPRAHCTGRRSVAHTHAHAHTHKHTHTHTHALTHLLTHSHPSVAISSHRLSRDCHRMASCRHASSSWEVARAAARPTARLWAHTAGGVAGRRTARIAGHRISMHSCIKWHIMVSSRPSRSAVHGKDMQLFLAPRRAAAAALRSRRRRAGRRASSVSARRRAARRAAASLACRR